MENFEEQLSKNENASLNAVEHQNETIEVLDNQSSNLSFSGSSTKKFKSVEALEKAYENLEKEFTKKCQALNSLKSENDKEKSPQYTREDWLQKVGEFLEKHQLAKNYTKQIAEVLTNNEELSKKEDALSLAYSMVLENNFKTKEELMQDETFLNEYVFGSEKIKNKIIEEYLQNISSSKTVPLISNVRGAGSVPSPKYQPKSLREASLYAQQILRK